MTNPMPRAALDTLAPYRAGAAAPVDDRKLASNENPFAPLPAVVDALSVELNRMNRYPDPGVTNLYAALSARFGLPQSNFAIGAGSGSVFGDLLRVMCEPGDEVVYAWRSFEAYPLWIHLSGARGVPVPLTDDARHDLDEMAKEISSATKVVVLCSPNNPTGTTINADELYAFLEKVPSNVLVVLDEAYSEFVRSPQAARGLSVFTAFNNVAVLRTFSKAYGLAGLRIGYVLAPEAITEAIRKVTTPFAVTNFAAIAAVESLKAEEQLRERVDQIVAERDRVLGSLRESRWTIPEPQGNFIWLNLGQRSTTFAAAAADKGLTVRVFGDEGVRVTIGNPEANDLFLEVALKGWI